MIPDKVKTFLLWAAAALAVAGILWPACAKAEEWDLIVMRDDNYEHQQGDIIAILPAGGRWTGCSNDQSRNFLIVRVSGLTKEEAYALTESQLDETDKESPVIVLPRKYRLDLARLKDSKLPEMSLDNVKNKGNYQPFMQFDVKIKMDSDVELYDKIRKVFVKKPTIPIAVSEIK